VGVLFLLPLVLCPSVKAAEPAVAILLGSTWSPGDSARQGAAEFEVLMCVAQTRRAAALFGLVGVGDRDGRFPPGAETALEQVARMGVPIVRLAQSTGLPARPGDVFIEGGSLSPEVAKQILRNCLARYGALPVSANPAQPTKKESAALQARIALFQAYFDSTARDQIAMR
jgi:hypothetical protein